MTQKKPQLALRLLKAAITYSPAFARNINTVIGGIRFDTTKKPQLALRLLKAAITCSLAFARNINTVIGGIRFDNRVGRETK